MKGRLDCDKKSTRARVVCMLIAGDRSIIQSSALCIVYNRPGPGLVTHKRVEGYELGIYYRSMYLLLNENCKKRLANIHKRSIQYYNNVILNMNYMNLYSYKFRN